MDTTNYLSDKDRIIDRITELFVATDQRDWPRVQACFTDKVQFDMTSVGGQNSEVTPAEITAGWDTGLKALKAIHHQIGNLQIAITGDTATSTCYGITYHYLPTQSGRDTRVFVGDYELKLEKHNDDWSISAFTFKLKFIDGNKELEKEAA